MTFDEVYFIEGQSAQGHMNIVNNPFLHIPGYPLGYPTYQYIPFGPLDNKDKLHDSVKEETKKRRRKKLLKLMILSQMMNNNN